MATLRRLRRVDRPAWAGVGMPAARPGLSALLVALFLATGLAAVQLAARSGPLEELPSFVAEALGQPRAADAGPAGWQAFENGISRRTSWGFESIAYRGSRAQKYLVVSTRQGPRTWRWKLAAAELASKRAAPVRVLDADGRALEPAAFRWWVERRGPVWLVRLRLIDTNLPLPYVLQPAMPAQRGLAER